MTIPILFCNIGWMKYYRGLQDDAIRGGGSYVDEHGDGGEMYNFLERPDGLIRGYVRSGGKININRLGAKQSDDSVGNILVVWVSKKPVVGGVYIVGWYEGATVYRKEQTKGIIDERLGRLDYLAETHPRNAVLLPEGWRRFQIPTGTDGLGQSHLWYAHEPANQKFRDDVQEYIQAGKLPLP